MREERLTSAKKENKREYFINGAKMTTLEKENVFPLEEAFWPSCMKYRLHERNTPIVVKSRGSLTRRERRYSCNFSRPSHTRLRKNLHE